MISLIWPTSTEGGTPIGLIDPRSTVSRVEMTLHIWVVKTMEGKEKIRYAYTPGSDIRFMTDAPEQHLIVKLSSLEQHLGAPRFHILGHSIRDPEFSLGAIGKMQGTSLPSPPPERPNKFPLGDKGDVSTVEADEIEITLALKQHSDSTYINIIVLDRKNGAILDCDPQVENGTKT